MNKQRSYRGLNAVVHEPPKPPVQVEMDGKTLTGRTWILPNDFVDDDIEAGRLVSLKGMTETTLPELESRTEPTEAW